MSKQIERHHARKKGEILVNDFAKGNGLLNTVESNVSGLVGGSFSPENQLHITNAQRWLINDDQRFPPLVVVEVDLPRSFPIAKMLESKKYSEVGNRDDGE